MQKTKAIISVTSKEANSILSGVSDVIYKPLVPKNDCITSILIFDEEILSLVGVASVHKFVRNKQINDLWTITLGHSNSPISRRAYDSRFTQFSRANAIITRSPKIFKRPIHLYDRIFNGLKPHNYRYIGDRQYSLLIFEGLRDYIVV